MMKRWRKEPLAILLAGAFFCSSASVGAAADLSLAKAIGLALAQNTELKLTRKAEETAEAALRQARGARGVSVDASGGYSYGRTWGDRGDATNSGVNAALKGGLSLWDGGKASGNIDMSKIDILKAHLRTARQQEELRLSVVQAYYNALQARKTVGVNQESVNNYQAHLTNVEQLFSAGSKARMDVLRASVELSNARQTLIKSENEYEVMLAKLRNIINMDRTEPLNLTDDAVYAPFGRDLAGCLLFGAGNRKDILADIYDIAKKEIDIDVVKADYEPQLDLNISASASKDFEPSSSDSRGVTAGLNLNWNIFDSGRKDARIEAAQTALDTARLQLEKDKDDVDYAIREAYFSMKEAEKRLDSTQDAVNKAKEDYYIAREKYRAGEGIMLDIIDAQLALSTAELNHISAQYDYARYQAQLENAMGVELTESEQRAADDMDVTPLTIAGVGRKAAVRAYEAEMAAVKRKEAERADEVIPYAGNREERGKKAERMNEENRVAVEKQEASQTGAKPHQAADTAGKASAKTEVVSGTGSASAKNGSASSRKGSDEASRAAAEAGKASGKTAGDAAGSAGSGVEGGAE